MKRKEMITLLSFARNQMLAIHDAAMHGDEYAHLLDRAITRDLGRGTQDLAVSAEAVIENLKTVSVEEPTTTIVLFK